MRSLAWLYLILEGGKWWDVLNAVMNRSVKCKEFLDHQRGCNVLN
jgi:hypothetical protein